MVPHKASKLCTDSDALNEQKQWLSVVARKEGIENCPIRENGKSTYSKGWICNYI